MPEFYNNNDILAPSENFTDNKSRYKANTKLQREQPTRQSPSPGKTAG